ASQYSRETEMASKSALPGPTREHLDWPFLGEHYKILAQKLDAYASSNALDSIDHTDVDETSRSLVRSLGDAGRLDAATGGGGRGRIDSRSVCLTRETLAWLSGLTDFAFAMQGHGTGAIALSGSHSLSDTSLPRARSGEWIAAFALSEK